MPKPSSALIEYIYKMAGAYGDDVSTDAQLLSRYAEMQDEQAFSALMARHGPMVWTICRRTLNNTQDVEEAYQTTFLALARQASKVSVNVVGWLHQVANRTALNARRNVKGQLKFEEHLKLRERKASNAGTATDENHDALHEEIARLPEKLRVPLILRYLEGRTEIETAQILGVAERTVRNRLMRGKMILQKRLIQLGLGLNTAMITSLLYEMHPSFAMPPGLATKTVKAAAAFRDGKLAGGLAKLAQDVVKYAPTAAPWWKTGWVISILCVSGIGAGAGGVVWKAGFFGTGCNLTSSSPTYPSSILMAQEETTPPKLDLYGDPLPPGALARLGTTRFRSFEDINSLIFTPDSTRIIAASKSCARLWNLPMGELVRQFDVNQVAGFSSDGRTLIGRDKESELALWDIATGKRSSRLPQDAAAVAPDGKTVAEVADGGVDKYLRVRSAANGKLIWEQRLVQCSKVSIHGYSPDSLKLNVTISLGQSSKFSVWEVATGKLLSQWNPPDKTKPIVSHAYSSDGRFLAVAVDNKKSSLHVSVINLATGDELRRWTKNEQYGCLHLTFSADGKFLAEGTCNGLIRLLNIASGQETRLCEENFLEIVQRLAFSPNGKLIAAGVFNESSKWSSVRIWNVATGREVSLPGNGHRSDVNSMMFSANGKQIIAGQFRGDITVWDALSGSELLQLPADNDAATLPPLAQVAATSPNSGKTAFFVVKLGKSLVEINSRVIIVRDNRSWKELRRFVVPKALPAPGNFQSFFSCNGSLLCCTSTDQADQMNLWDMSNGEKIFSFKGSTAAFLSGGKILASIAPRRDKGVDLVLWDAATGAQLGSAQYRTKPRFKEDETVQSRISFSADGSMLMDERHRGGRTYVALSFVTWPEAKGSVAPMIDPCCELARDQNFDVHLLSSDCNTLAWADHKGAIHLCEIASDKDRSCLQGDAGEISALAFSPDSRRLAASYQNTTILLWDATGRLQKNGAVQAVQLQKDQIEKAWEDLAGRDTVQAGRAIWALVAGGGQSVAFLKNRLQPARRPTKETVVRLLADLDSDIYTVRLRARQKLQAFGEFIESELRQSKKGATVEKVGTLNYLLDVIGSKRHSGLPPGGELRSLRAVEVLGHIGTTEATRPLQKLAAGAPDARLTRAAQQCLWRTHTSLDRGPSN